MAKYQKQPLFVYDEPISYDSLFGGINNDPSNGNIADTELRDAVNVTYNNRTLEKRLGAKLYKDLKFHELDPGNSHGFAQMQSVFTAKHNTYYLVIRDGHLFYSLLNVVNDTLVMVELPIYISNDYFDGTINNFNSKYLIHSLPVVNDGEEPNRLLNQEGYIIYQEHDKDIDFPFTELDDGEHVGLFVPGNSYRLVLQNYRNVSSLVHDDTLYIATGTRFLQVKEIYKDGRFQLEVKMVEPKENNSWEYGNIGFNYLSPYPEHHVFDTSELNVARISNIRCLTHHVFIGDTSTKFKTVMMYKQGTDSSDYYFKWEIRNLTDETDWVTLVEFADGKGMDEYDLVHSTQTYNAGDAIAIRATFSNDFFEDAEKTKPEVAVADTGATYVSHVLEAGTSDNYSPLANQKFLEIQSCNRVLADGNKIILYGALNNSGNWYKSVLETNPKFDYFSDTGQLNFQTNKNERIISCIHLDGNIVVFCDNQHLGGSIHLVTGNGDDYQGDQYFSPYKRRLIHSSISCDHPNSVQYVENYVLFKYRTTIWLLDSRELNSERINLIPVNSRIDHNNPKLRFPNIPYSPRYESELFSYVSDECYVLVFPKEEVRWKMYFKESIRYENENHITYPWLRDLSPLLNCKGLLNINNQETYLTSNFQLVQFNSIDYSDLGEEYKMRIITKAWDLTYKNIVKFVNSIMLNYSRGNTSILKLNLYAFNESAIRLIGPRSEAFIDKYTGKVVYANKDNYYDEDAHDMDKPSLILNTTNLGNAKIGIPYFSSKMFHSEKRFPMINVSVAIESSSKEAFSLSSISFNYITTDISPKTLPKLYSEILREE